MVDSGAVESGDARPAIISLSAGRELTPIFLFRVPVSGPKNLPFKKSSELGFTS